MSAKIHCESMAAFQSLTVTLDFNYNKPQISSDPSTLGLTVNIQLKYNRIMAHKKKTRAV